MLLLNRRDVVNDLNVIKTSGNLSVYYYIIDNIVFSADDSTIVGEYILTETKTLQTEIFLVTINKCNTKVAKTNRNIEIEF